MTNAGCRKVRLLCSLTKTGHLESYTRALRIGFASTGRTQPSSARKPIPNSRHRRALNLPLWLLAALAAVLISGCGFLVDRLIHKADRLLASDFYTLVIAFVFSYALLSYEARRRALLRRRMQIAADVNHHIRNALTSVVYTAAVQNDPALTAVIEDATARIDWVLNTVLPDGSDDLRWPVQSPEWTPSEWERRAHNQLDPN